MRSIQLGDTVTDQFSGISGVVTGITTYLHASPRVLVQRRGLGDKGEPFEPLWLDENQLALADV